jgi:DNA-binding CsgD family transcriptional regulator
MQMQLPIFPENTKMINSSVGFYSKDDFVFYLHNGSPVFCHSKDQLNSYRFILANLTKTGLCSCIELSTALGINVKNVQRYKQALETHGTDWFFNREDNRGQCHKFTKDKLVEAQNLLNSGYSQKAIALRLGVSEGAVRYHLRNRALKKNFIR